MIEPAMQDILVLLSDPAAWLALATLVVMEVVLGIDNLIFISILTNKLPEHQRSAARRAGIGLAVILRLGLLASVAFLALLALGAVVDRQPARRPLHQEPLGHHRHRPAHLAGTLPPAKESQPSGLGVLAGA